MGSVQVRLRQSHIEGRPHVGTQWEGMQVTETGLEGGAYMPEEPPAPGA